MHIIYEAIKNMIEIKIHPDEIAAECVARNYRIEIRMYEFTPKSLYRFYLNMAEMAWYMKYGNHDYSLTKTEGVQS